MPAGSKPKPGPRARRIAAILRRAAEDAGISQTDLGRRAGISQSNISDYLSGKKTLDVDQIQTLCDLLGLDADTVWAESTP